MSKLKVLGKLNPVQYKQMLDHLTKKKIKNPFIKADDIIVNKKPEVEEREVINAFMKRNPRQDLAGGGMLVQPSADGSRPGYKNERRVLGDPITIDGKQYKKVIEGPDKGKYVIREGQNNPRQFVNKSEIKKTVKANIEKGKQNLKEMYAQRTVLNKRATANRSKWIKNWLNKNLNKYNVREFNNFQNDLLNDFNAEVEKNPNKYGTSRKDFPLTRDGFPIYGDQKIGGEIYDGISFTRATADRSQLLSYQKIFFKNKLKDKDFKAKVNSYLDWNLTKKVEGGAGAMTKTAALDYGKFTKGFDEDVVYLMGEILNNRALNPGGGQIGIHDVFKKIFGKKGEAYFKKYQGSWGRWKDNFDAVAKLAGLDQSQAKALLQKQINDSQNIMKLFNVKNLPPEFVVAQDHLFGLAEAKALGDPKIARQTLKALVATTKEQNRILGQGGFSQKRTALIKKFKNAPLEKKATIVNQLNTLADEYVPGRIKYNVKKDGSLKITNLQPEPTFKSKATAYQDLAKDFPAQIKKLIATLGGGDCGRGLKNQGGRIGLQDGTPNVDVCFKNATNRINSGFKNATPAEARNYTKLLNAVKGSAVIGKNLLKFGIVPEALFVGADTLVRMGFGDTFEEAGLRAADFFIPGNLTQEADKLKVQRTLGDAAATNVGRVFDYRNQIAKIDNLQSQKQNLENLSDVGEFDYIGDLSQDVKNIDMSLNQAKNDLQNKFMVSEAEAVAADKTLEEAYDISKAKSPLAGLQLFARNIEGVKEDPFLSDITTPEKTQMELNLNMFPTLPKDLMKLKTLDAIDLAQALRAEGRDVSAKDILAYRDSLKEMPLMDAANQFGREQIFGTQGTFFGQPLAGGGIAKLAGDSSGRPPESGPNSQGLQGLMKRVKNL